MLRALDMLIGLAVVMVIVSVAVTTVVQIVAALRNWRGKHLLEGVTLLLAQAHPSLGTHARALAVAVLKHPLLQVNGRLGDYVSKDELVRVLLALASDEQAAQPTARGLKSWGPWLAGEPRPSALGTEARGALRQALAAGGLAEPAQVLKRIHLRALSLEAAHPALDGQLRQRMAVLHEASSEIVARMHAWFDHGMERVKQRFTYDMHKLTTLCALLIALALQLDALNLMRELSTDSQLRAALVEEAAAALKSYDEATAHPDVGDAAAALARVDAQRERLDRLGMTGYTLLPPHWLADWRWSKAPGILLSWVLLSLGAPFWYEALKNLLRFRSILAARDERATGAPAAAVVVEPPRES